jgi:hypothetical protein
VNYCDCGCARELDRLQDELRRLEDEIRSVRHELEREIDERRRAVQSTGYRRWR